MIGIPLGLGRLDDLKRWAIQEAFTPKVSKELRPNLTRCKLEKVPPWIASTSFWLLFRNTKCALRQSSSLVLLLDSNAATP